ncbi:MAG: hypothetical protein HQM12_15330 [SAR324 cluster bacterium]|nr:hypothetical protein [SAR324 cluster bacterium]
MPFETGFQEDLTYILEWMEQARQRATEVAKLAELQEKYSVFTISSTAKPTSGFRPYLTPLRQNSTAIFSGAVVYTQSQAIALCQKVDGLVSCILVDAEKKIPVLIDPDLRLLSPQQQEIILKRSQTVLNTESGYLTSVCFETINKSHFYEFKPNDLTADAVWYFISRKLRVLSGKSFAIIGFGNIGFKVALRLLESGASVNVVRRDENLGMQLANTLNILKPFSTIASANYTSCGVNACLMVDAVIGCSNEPSVIDADMISVMKKNGYVVDVGKGTLTAEAIDLCQHHQIEIYRTDITAALDGVVSAIFRNSQILENEIGRKTISGISLVSGGLLGENGAIVVDNVNHPQQIFGVSNGRGELKQKQEYTEQDQLNLKTIQSSLR